MLARFLGKGKQFHLTLCKLRLGPRSVAFPQCSDRVFRHFSDDRDNRLNSKPFSEDADDSVDDGEESDYEFDEEDVEGLKYDAEMMNLGSSSMRGAAERSKNSFAGVDLPSNIKVVTTSSTLNAHTAAQLYSRLSESDRQPLSPEDILEDLIASRTSVSAGMHTMTSKSSPSKGSSQSKSHASPNGRSREEEEERYISAKIKEYEELQMQLHPPKKPFSYNIKVDENFKISEAVANGLAGYRFKTRNGQVYAKEIDLSKDIQSDEDEEEDKLYDWLELFDPETETIRDSGLADRVDEIEDVSEFEGFIDELDTKEGFEKFKRELEEELRAIREDDDDDDDDEFDEVSDLAGLKEVDDIETIEEVIVKQKLAQLRQKGLSVADIAPHQSNNDESDNTRISAAEYKDSAPDTEQSNKPIEPNEPENESNVFDVDGLKFEINEDEDDADVTRDYAESMQRVFRKEENIAIKRKQFREKRGLNIPPPKYEGVAKARATESLLNELADGADIKVEPTKSVIGKGVEDKDYEIQDIQEYLQERLTAYDENEIRKSNRNSKANRTISRRHRKKK